MMQLRDGLTILELAEFVSISGAKAYWYTDPVYSPPYDPLLIPWRIYDLQRPLYLFTLEQARAYRAALNKSRKTPKKTTRINKKPPL